MNKFTIRDNGRIKIIESGNYNTIFDRVSGDFMRWGANPSDDPEMAPCPEILDMEIATACDGIGIGNSPPKVCAFCYKANKKTGQQMSFETFKKIFEVLCPVVSTKITLDDDTVVEFPAKHEILLSTGELCCVENMAGDEDIMDLRWPLP